MPVIKNLKKKGTSALARSKNRTKAATQGAKDGSLVWSKKRATASKKAQRPLLGAKFNADAWDAGAAERLEQEKAVKSSGSSSKRIRFEPAPVTLILPSQEDALRQRMGEFAGPLLGALWEEKPVSAVSTGVSFEPSKDAPPATKRNANKFAALGSDSEADGEEMEGTSGSSSKVVFKAPTLDLSRITAAALQPKGDLFAFKPSVLDANRLLQGATAVSSSSMTVEFKQASFEVPAFQAPTLFQSFKSSTNDEFEDL